MEAKFGVQLKSKDDAGRGPRAGSPAGSRPPGAGKRTELKTKPVSDLKAMFDKAEGDSSSKAFKEFGTTYGKKTTVTKTTEQSATKTVAKGNVTTTSKEKVTVTKSKSNELDPEDLQAFEALRVKLKKTGLSALDDEAQTVTSSVAVAKTYNGGVAYKASIETKKINKAGQDDEGDKSEVSRGNVASMLSFGLTKLRTRPGSKNVENLSRSNSVEDDSQKAPNSPRSESPRPRSPTLRELNKDSKYVPGAPKGWKGSSETRSGRSSPSPNAGKFSDSTVGKLKQEISVPKIQGFRSVSPINAKNSSDESSSSSNISPRGYKPINSALSPRKEGEKKTDVNENIKKFEGNKNSANVFKSENVNSNRTGAKDTSVPQWRKKLENTQPKSKFSASEKTDITSSKTKTAHVSRTGDSDKGRQSPKPKWSEKGRLSLEDIKKEQSHRPLSRASSSGSNSSFSRGDSEPPEGQSGKTARTSDPDVRRKMALSKKLSSGKFQELKKGFENKPESNPTSPKLDKKLKTDIKSKKILERKQSFEGGEIFKKRYERQEVVSVKDRGNVLETVKSLNELDAKAKAQPSLVRRTRSLPSDSLEDDSSADYYQDIDIDQPGHFGMTDDASNEGDISSESDQLYEEIPGVPLSQRGRFSLNSLIFSLICYF